MFYFDWKINIADIIIDLIIIIITTGLTYIIFTYIPICKRKKKIKKELRQLKYFLHSRFLEPAISFNGSYRYLKKGEKRNKTTSKLKNDLLIVKKLTIFTTKLEELSNFKSDFLDYLNKNRIFALIDSLFLDEDSFIDLSLQITRLEKMLNIMEKYYIKIDKKIFKPKVNDSYMKEKCELICKNDENDYVSQMISIIKEINELISKITLNIDEI